jgi:hypothetical protein
MGGWRLPWFKLQRAALAGIGSAAGDFFPRLVLQVFVDLRVVPALHRERAA